MHDQGRPSLARLLAPLALVITAVALIAVLTSGGGETGTDEGHRGAKSRALPVDELDDGHGVARLVMAYTNRFTPMRSAAS